MVTAASSVLAQDFAQHGTFKEPNTNITFYTAFEPNGTDPQGFSQASIGGYTFGIALPPSAATVDFYDYIGLIVSVVPKNCSRTLLIPQGWLYA
jgi:cellobiose dehydrogenase (acceptor)